METTPTRKTKEIADQEPQGGRIRPSEAPLDKELTDTFNEVQPEAYRGHSRSSIDAGVADPDADDTIGGE